MAGFKDFEEIIAWQRAVDLAGIVHERFKDHRDFSFRDQIRRAATSISSNIAEGFDRGSNRDFARFLRIARGSCNEVRSLLHVGKRFGYFSDQEVLDLRENCMRLAAMIQALIKALRIDTLRSFAPWLLPLASWLGAV